MSICIGIRIPMIRIYVRSMYSANLDSESDIPYCWIGNWKRVLVVEIRTEKVVVLLWALLGKQRTAATSVSVCVWNDGRFLFGVWRLRRRLRRMCVCVWACNTDELVLCCVVSSVLGFGWCYLYLCQPNGGTSGPSLPSSDWFFPPLSNFYFFSSKTILGI